MERRWLCLVVLVGAGLVAPIAVGGKSSPPNNWRFLRTFAGPAPVGSVVVVATGGLNKTVTAGVSTANGQREGRLPTRLRSWTLVAYLGKDSRTGARVICVFQLLGLPPQASDAAVGGCGLIHGVSAAVRLPFPTSAVEKPRWLAVLSGGDYGEFGVVGNAVSGLEVANVRFFSMPWNGNPSSLPVSLIARDSTGKAIGRNRWPTS